MLRDRLLALVLRPTAPPVMWGVATAAVLIAGEVLLVHLLKRIAPDNAFGAVFLLGVLVVSAGWGFGLALATSLASTLAYVWFHVHEGSGSLAPAVIVFLTLALLTNVLVGQARLRAAEANQRRREADLAAELARIMLRAVDLPAALDAAGRRMADVLELPYATLTVDAVAANTDDEAIPLLDAQVPVGSLQVPAGLSASAAQRVRRMVPSLEALLAAARDREQVNAALESTREQARRQLEDSHVAVSALAQQQTALRRVATLVARAAPPEEVFGAVAEEVGRLLGTDFTVMSRYDPDGAATVVGVWARTGTARVLPVGLRMDFGGRNVHTLVFQTGRPERIDDYAGASGDAADAERDSGFRSAVGVPISVEDRLWGVMSVASTREEPLSADTKGRLAAFTELIVTALVNAEAQAALNASRARIVATADRTRRRIERNLHDGAQQRLVSLVLHLQEMQEAAPGAGELAGRLKGAVTEVTEVLEELREIAHGIHPAILTVGGLRPALEALARRSAVPVSLDISVAERLPEPVEIAAYYAVSEALTNTAKHAHASGADVEVAARDGGLRVCVRDDGRGGADFAGGSGLAGIKDRMEALGGQIWLQSPPGTGTAMQIVIPLSGPGTPGPPTGAASSPQ